jgi:hypothetical protein
MKANYNKVMDIKIIAQFHVETLVLIFNGKQLFLVHLDKHFVVAPLILLFMVLVVVSQKIVFMHKPIVHETSILKNLFILN